MLRYLADHTNSSDFIRGIDKLTQEQKEVLFARLTYELKKEKKSEETNDSKKEVITAKKIQPRREISDKPRSIIECCLHCGSVAIKKKGFTKGGVQRYQCRDCGKSFSENYGLITHYTHLSEWQWQEAIRATIVGMSITELSKNISVSTSTAWLCRMKIFGTLKNIFSKNDTCDGLVESDGKYLRISFKGCKDKSYFINRLGRLPRHHRSRADRIEYLGDDYKKLFKSNPHLLKEMIYSSQKRMVGRDAIDINHQHLCILTAIDRDNNIYIEPATSGTAKSQDIYKRMTTVIKKDAVFITDEHNSYKFMCRKNIIEHVIIDSNIHTSGAYSLSRINSLHSAIERYFGSKEYLPATKYIDLYLKMFWWLQKNKDCNTSELTDKLYKVVTGYVDNNIRSEMERITIKGLVTRPLPFDTKGFY